MNLPCSLWFDLGTPRIILLRSPALGSEQADSSPKTTLNPQPSKIKSPTKGKKSPVMPKVAPKRAKKKETEGQATLTSEELTMNRGIKS